MNQGNELLCTSQLGRTYPTITVDFNIANNTLVSQVVGLVAFAALKTSIRCEIPAQMLWGLCREQNNYSEWDKPRTTSTHAGLAEEARLFALHLVHSVNLAIYLGVIDELLVSIPDRSDARVSLSSFLEILHPEKPRCDAETALKIINCCRTVLDFQFIPTPAQVATHLPTKCLVGILVGTDGSRTAPIPGIIAQIFPVEHNSGRRNKRDQLSETYRMLDLIDTYLAYGARGGSTILWDHLTAQSSIFETESPNRDRVFVPAQIKSDLAFGHWRLDQSVQLNIEKLYSADFGITAMFSQEFIVVEAPSRTLDGFRNLTCHLYPAEQWEDMEKVRQMAQIMTKTSRKRHQRNIDRIEEPPMDDMVQHAFDSLPKYI